MERPRHVTRNQRGFDPNSLDPRQRDGTETG
jgi:hypothetical protein